MKICLGSSEVLPCHLTRSLAYDSTGMCSP